MTEKSLYKVATVYPSDLRDDEEEVFDCCLCGNLDEPDEAGGLVTTVEVARTLNQIRDARSEEELMVPLQKVAKYAASFSGTRDAQTALLKDVLQMKGLATILKALSTNINDPAVTICAVNAVRSLIGTHDDMLDDWEQKRSVLADTRESLIFQLLSENGMETFTRAFGIHAIKYDPYDDDTQMILYRKDLRVKIMEVLYVTTPAASTDKVAKLLKFWCRVIPKMLPPSDAPNDKVIEQAFLCVLKCLEHKGIQKQLSKADILEIVSVSVQAEKSCDARSVRVSAAIRSVWSWAGAFSPV